MSCERGNVCSNHPNCAISNGTISDRFFSLPPQTPDWHHIHAVVALVGEVADPSQNHLERRRLHAGGVNVGSQGGE